MSFSPTPFLILKKKLLFLGAEQFEKRWKKKVKVQNFLKAYIFVNYISLTILFVEPYAKHCFIE